jgi:hypothetical protein
MSDGAAGDLYNILGPDRAPIVCKMKAIASREGFATLERWLGQADALFLRRDQADPLVVLPWQTWALLVPGMHRPGSATAANAENCLLAQSGPDAAEAGPGNSAPASAVGDPGAIALDELIAARQPTHGDFAETAAIAQALKAVFAAAGADRFEPVQREALDQIAVKLARICAGDPTCADHWLDLAAMPSLPLAMSAPAKLSGIALLRELVGWIATQPDGGGEAPRAFVSGIAVYEAGAADGLDLGDCLGLTPAPGQAAWWTIERRAKAGGKILEIDRLMFPEPCRPSMKSRADRIAGALGRYENGGWLREWTWPVPPADPLRRLLWQLLKLGEAPSARTIRRLLAEARSWPIATSFGGQLEFSPSSDAVREEIA